MGSAFHLARPAGFRPSAFVAETTCSDPAAAAATAAPPRVMSATHAARLCGADGVLIADVRPAERFAEGHVAGALHLPCAASSDLLDRAHAAAAGKRTLVVYGESTSDANAIAASLRQRLHRPDLELVVLDGGFAAWSAEGLACSSGPCPDCGMQARTRP